MAKHGTHYCRCKQCRKNRRKGLILGSFWTHYYVYGGLMKVSGYVPYHRFMKGRRRKERKGYREEE